MSKTVSLYEHVLNELGRDIVGGQLVPGTRLVLSDLEERFAVSRTVARDAVRVLESLGLATSRRRAGIEVMPANVWHVLDPQVIAWRLEVDRAAQIMSLTGVREAIEPVAAGLAAEHATSAQRTRFVELAAVMERLGSQGLGRTPEFLTADIEFHTLLLGASGNEMLAAMDGMVSDVLRARSDYHLTPDRPDPRAVAEHQQLAAAIAAGDGEAASLASRGLLAVIVSELEPTLGSADKTREA